MGRMVGTVSRGVRAPIIREGDDLVKIVIDTVIDAAKEHKYEIHDRDIVAMTEAIVARAQGNIVSVASFSNTVLTKDEQGGLKKQSSEIIFGHKDDSQYFYDIFIKKYRHFTGIQWKNEYNCSLEYNNVNISYTGESALYIGL